MATGGGYYGERLFVIRSDDRLDAAHPALAGETRLTTHRAEFAPEPSQMNQRQKLHSITVRNVQLTHDFYNVRNYTHPVYGPMNTLTYTDHAATRTLTLAEGFYTLTQLIGAIHAATFAPAGGAVSCVQGTYPAYRTTFADAAATSLKLPYVTNAQGDEVPQWIARLLGFGIGANTASTGGPGLTLTAENIADVRPTTFVHFAFRGVSTQTSLSAHRKRPRSDANDVQGSQFRYIVAVPLSCTYGETLTWAEADPLAFTFAHEGSGLDRFRIELVDDAGVLLPTNNRWTLITDLSLSSL